MRSTLDELTKELAELMALVESINPVNAALSGHESSLVRQYVRVRRRFDYAAFAVALYASFEKFIENLVAAFAQLESRRLQYTELPQKLVTKHRIQTAEMLSRGRIGEGRYVGLTELDVVKNLFECLNGNTPYSLNEAAVVAHDRNLRANEIDTLFAAVGIENVCKRVRRGDALLKWYRKVKGLDACPDGVPTTVIEERIKDLVERRNQIAHRGGAPHDQLPGIDEMFDSVGFILAFGCSVFAITVGKYLETHHAESAGRADLKQRQDDGPFEDGTVVIVEKPTQRLFVGQPVFVIVKSTSARWGRIQSLQVDDSRIQVFLPEDKAPSGIGIKLDFKCPSNAILIALAKDDDIVWSPLNVATTPA